MMPILLTLILLFAVMTYADALEGFSADCGCCGQ